jgi:hypothetical protein
MRGFYVRFGNSVKALASLRQSLAFVLGIGLLTGVVLGIWLFFLYIAHLKTGRKFLKDSTVFWMSGLCLIAEIAYVILLTADS